jgi:hypothetical protein
MPSARKIFSDRISRETILTFFPLPRRGNAVFTQAMKNLKRVLSFRRRLPRKNQCGGQKSIGNAF